MTAMMVLEANSKVVRSAVKTALSLAGVEHVAEDDEGLFGEFAASQLYVAVNDVIWRPELSMVNNRPGWPVTLQMVFHFAPGQLEAGLKDIRAFVEALAPATQGEFVVHYGREHVCAQHDGETGLRWYGLA